MRAATLHRQRVLSFFLFFSLSSCQLLTCDVQARNGLLVLEFKAELLGVGAENLNGSELEANEALVAASEGIVTLLNHLSRGTLLLRVSVDTGTDTNGTYNKGDGRDIVALRRGLGGVLAEAL
jgi:hypothetical protein